MQYPVTAGRRESLRRNIMRDLDYKPRPQTLLDLLDALDVAIDALHKLSEKDSRIAFNALQQIE